MTGGFWWSEDMETWQYHAAPNLPAYDYAPDVRVIGEWLYFCASSHEAGVHYRTKEPFSDAYERMDGAFPFWDPNLFADDDGRVYFYWGSSPREPICGIELNPETMQPIGEKVPLFANNESANGFERRGEDHVPQRSEEEKEAMLRQLEAKKDIPPLQKQLAIDYIQDRGYIEGSWMTKHDGRYYLQYGAAGAQFNIYGDGVYESDRPLGPFRLAKNNPFSYKPGGFIPGAGHGSTWTDKEGASWHISTMRISVNHVFERRLGLWPVGWDEEGEMFCNQRYGDWPYSLNRFRKDIFAEPEWMLLSVGKPVTASSEAAGCPADHASEENVRTWWKAASNQPGEWILLDLQKVCEVHAVQVNFADDHPDVPLPSGKTRVGDLSGMRWIDPVPQKTRWILEGSRDGEHDMVLADRSKSETDLSHDLAVLPEGEEIRYVRLTVLSVPYGQPACVSGLRVFGREEGEKPDPVTSFDASWQGPLDLDLSWRGSAMGYEVLWGYAPDKLYHSREVYASKVHLGSFVKGQDVYVRIDSFNGSGITHGTVQKCR